MKYADAPTASVETTVAAAPDVVWALVSDITTPTRFSPELQGAEWTGDERGLGATFHGHNKHAAVGEWTTPNTITDYAEGSVFEWTVGDLANKTARWRFELEPAGDGTRLRFSAEMGPGPSGLTFVIEKMPDREEEIVVNRLQEWTANMQSTVDGIKELAEAA